MRRFVSFLFTFTALAQIPFVLGLGWLLARANAPFGRSLAVVPAIVAVVLFRGRVRQLMRDRPISGARMLLLEEPYYVHWCASVLSVFLFVVGLLVAPLVDLALARPFDVGEVAAIAYAASLPVAVWGVVVRRRWTRVRTIDVPIASLHPSFDGYRIAQLSDLHIGSMNPRRRAQRWAERVNRLGVDLVALTGDYVTNGVAFHDDIADVIGALRAKDGAIAVMGNHDYFGDGEPLVEMLRARGVAVLRNESASVDRGDARLVVAGIDDTWTSRADVDRAMDELIGAERSPVVALAHDPQLFPALADRGADLVLSGHTHWGQVAVPFAAARLNLSRFSYRFHAGINKIGTATLYIHPGLGTTGPPVRLGAAPEITIIRLRAAAA